MTLDKSNFVMLFVVILETEMRLTMTVEIIVRQSVTCAYLRLTMTVDPLNLGRLNMTIPYM